jgi:hydrogenase maturation protein HypF
MERGTVAAQGVLDSPLDLRMRRAIRVRGVVQGVGFRPFVHRLATELHLGGHVGNDTDGVFIEIEGNPGAVWEFERRLNAEAPPLARVDAVEAADASVGGEQAFRIVDSHAGAEPTTFVPPDVATCVDCLRELFDPADRRYRYPFTNCTNCGPRFTITIRLPYDRPDTTMQRFPMCAACESEYQDPCDRRYHAQPVACAACGPHIWFESANADVHGTDAALATTQRALAGGAVVAVKGLGGFHLACDAWSNAAVATLRRRKRRADKPFAVMVRDLDVARELADFDDEEAARLISPERPIVLLRRRRDSSLSPLVAPGNPLVGVMLPYTPLHHLLFDSIPGENTVVPDVLVMSSGNLSDEPICYYDVDARERLAPIADAWLMHDRPIHVPCDDSVIRVVDGEELPIRRSRGYAPLPIPLPFETVPVIGAGGELKNTFCVAKRGDAWMSQHIGDMGSVETLRGFEHSVHQFTDMYGIDAESVAADCHPGYHTRRWAEDHYSETTALVQHHHAHVASVMAEHEFPVSETVIGFAFDGTGYGTDGAIWGGEVMAATYDGFDRVAHLRYVPLPGGDATIRKPYRAALAHLWAAGIDWAPCLPPTRAARPDELRVLERQLERGVHCVPTSSMGRLFDTVSSLLDVRHVVSYEAQAAIELEAMAESCLASARGYAFSTMGDEIDPAPVVRAIVDDLRDGHGRGAIAAGFHVAVARLVADIADRTRERTGLDTVALSGGVFQNVLLLRLTRDQLRASGFRVLTHRVVPPNDGGLALGQVAVTARKVVCG